MLALAVAIVQVGALLHAIGHLAEPPATLQGEAPNKRLHGPEAAAVCSQCLAFATLASLAASGELAFAYASTGSHPPCSALEDRALSSFRPFFLARAPPALT